MITAYVVVTIILAVLWVIFTAMGIFASAEEKDKQLFQQVAAIMSIAATVVFLWPLYLLLAIPAFLVYGLWVLVTKRKALFKE
jgi:hypothetical protein